MTEGIPPWMSAISGGFQKIVDGAMLVIVGVGEVRAGMDVLRPARTNPPKAERAEYVDVGDADVEVRDVSKAKPKQANANVMPMPLKK